MSHESADVVLPRVRLESDRFLITKRCRMNWAPSDFNLSKGFRKRDSELLLQTYRSSCDLSTCLTIIIQLSCTLTVNLLDFLVEAITNKIGKCCIATSNARSKVTLTVLDTNLLTSLVNSLRAMTQPSILRERTTFYSAPAFLERCI